MAFIDLYLLFVPPLSIVCNVHNLRPHPKISYEFSGRMEFLGPLGSSLPWESSFIIGQTFDCMRKLVLAIAVVMVADSLRKEFTDQGKRFLLYFLCAILTGYSTCRGKITAIQAGLSFALHTHIRLNGSPGPEMKKSSARLLWPICLFCVMSLIFGAFIWAFENWSGLPLAKTIEFLISGCNFLSLLWIRENYRVSPNTMKRKFDASEQERKSNVVSRTPRHYGLKWEEHAFEWIPTWTVEPEISVVKEIALEHLDTRSWNYEISFFGGGTFNKLYLISPLNSSEPTPLCYMMRLALPVDPYYKTESEVATLEYVRLKTSIPVPRVIAYDSSANNKLGFEWILMERINGVPLQDFWASPKLTWKERKNITKTFAGYAKEMEGLRFDKIGSLYRTHERLNPTQFTPLKDDPDFALGSVVSTLLFAGNRAKISANRGPFATSAAWMKCLLSIQIAALDLQLYEEHPNPINDDEDDEDEVYTEELEGMLNTAKDLLSLVPDFFPSIPAWAKKRVEGEVFVLHHSDISAYNVLIDPITHEVTGVVDWECASAQPLWKARRYPQFLRGPEINPVSDCPEYYRAIYGNPIPEIPPPPSEDDEDPRRSAARGFLEKMLLRRIFDSELKEVRDKFVVEGARLKRDFENNLIDSWIFWTDTAKWVEDFNSGKQKEADPDQILDWSDW